MRNVGIYEGYFDAAGSAPGSWVYSNWDAALSFGCNCNFGFGGPDCSLSRFCCILFIFCFQCSCYSVI